MIADIKFAFHVISHPFDGFWDMKHEKKGKMWVAIVCIILFAIANFISAEFSSFLFNDTKFKLADILFEFEKVGILLIVVCLANWSVTTLMEGEGTFKDIFMTFGYACLPVSIITIPATILTNVASYSEGVYINILNYGAMVWFIALLFFGLMTVHQYSLGQMVLTTILTIVAAAVIIFVYLLFFSLITRMFTFFATIFKELSFRLK